MKAVKMLKHARHSLEELTRMTAITNIRKLSNKSRSKRATIITPRRIHLSWFESGKHLNDILIEFLDTQATVTFLECEGIIYEEERTTRK